jgi:hypothetical protein
MAPGGVACVKDAPTPTVEATGGDHEAEAAASTKRSAVEANTPENQTPTTYPGPHALFEQRGLGSEEGNR